MNVLILKEDQLSNSSRFLPAQWFQDLVGCGQTISNLALRANLQADGTLLPANKKEHNTLQISKFVVDHHINWMLNTLFSSMPVLLYSVSIMNSGLLVADYWPFFQNLPNLYIERHILVLDNLHGHSH